MKKKASDLTIATYNIQFSANVPKIIENLEIMAKKGVAVFCLQEVINILDQELIVRTIIKKLGPEWKAIYHVGEETSKHSIGTCIIWNTKIITLEREQKILLPKIKKLALHEFVFDKLIGGLAVPLQRRATSCFFTFQGKTICITSLHTDNIGGPLHRITQIKSLLEQLKLTQKTKYEIICGDFNNIDVLKTGKEKILTQKLLGNEFIEASEQVGWTFDLHILGMQSNFKLFKWFFKIFNIHLRRQLDYIWTKNFAIVDCYKLEVSGSDHFPLISTLKLQ